jgi:hypothetical protein
MTDRPGALRHWFLKMILVFIGISLVASSADWALAAAGFPERFGSILVAMVCALFAFRSPTPVADAFLQWRVGAWGARIMFAPMVVAEVIATPLLPFWGVVLVMTGTIYAAFMLVGWVVERWARQAPRLHDQAKEQAQE